MKKPEYQIIEKLRAYDPNLVLRAFRLFKEQQEKSSSENIQDLINDGWIPSKEEPVKGTPFHFLFGLYWIPSKEKRQAVLDKVKSKNNTCGGTKPPNKRKAVKREGAMTLNKTDLSCPICSGKIYKQSICPKCKEGKSGYKIRLICEENPDHEILL